MNRLVTACGSTDTRRAQRLSFTPPIFPTAMAATTYPADRAAAKRVTEAMMDMRKTDTAAIKAVRPGV